MPLTTPPARRVVWEDGMHLTPQHFQAQRRYHEAQVTRTMRLLAPFAHGVSTLLLDEDAVRNGTVVLQEAQGVLPDGTVFHIPEADAAPPPLTLATRFSPTRDAHVVHLALPAWRPEAANVQEEGSVGPPETATRFVVREDVVADEATGGDPTVVRFAARNLQLVLDDALTDELLSLPVARVQRDGRGQFQFDPAFIPPVLQLGASARLLALVREVVGLLEAKGGSLAATMVQAPGAAAGGAAAYGGNELATRWLLHAVRSAEAPLRHLLFARRAHPERLYAELARLAGALATFSFTRQARDVPAYRHDDLTTTFDGLEATIRSQLDVVISSRALHLPLQASSDILHVTPITEPRAFEPGVRWFLGVRAALPAADLIDRVTRLTKSCASGFVLELVRRAFTGLPTEHLPAPPAGLAPRQDLTYFELSLTGPCAQAMQQSREFGVYVPAEIPGAYLELAILLPA
jgi:type VI secretion system protein ImpJ